MKKLFCCLAVTGIVLAQTAPVAGDEAATANSVNAKPLISERAAARFLDQASWGPTPATILEIQRTGMGRWIEDQFHLNTSDLPDQAILNAAGNSNNDMRPVQAAFFMNAVQGKDQLRQRVAFALSKIWVISELEVNPAYAFPPYWRVLRDNAFANYRDLIKAMTLNPGMGRYLNMANNNKGNASKGTSANENYGRELMQLFTLGLQELNPDGSLAVDSKNQPVSTYTPAQVTAIANALTGWTYPTAPNTAAKTNNPAYYIGQMFAVEANHDTSAKTLVGNFAVKANQSAAQDLESVLDALMARQTMAPFICQQLIQQLVTSNPSAAYINRVSDVFLDNGHGVRGDLKAVIRAILLDREARDGDDAGASSVAAFGHLREPVLFMANVLRGLDSTISSTSTVYNFATNMGQNLFSPPSVFSYFAPQNRIQGGLLGPEFQIYSTQTASYRANVVNTVIYGNLDSATKADLTPYNLYVKDSAKLIDYVSYVLLHHAMSDGLRQAALTAVNAATTNQKKVQAALYVVLTSGEYQIIH